mgnify:CR=1 FL=1
MGIRGGGAPVVSYERAVAAIVAFCDVAQDTPNDASQRALAELIRIANVVRPRGPICQHQNEDYPEHRCALKTAHKGRHDDGNWCSW